MKILIEIFCQKLIVSNVILALLDQLKTKLFFTGQSWWPTDNPHNLKFSGSAPADCGILGFQYIIWLSIAIMARAETFAKKDLILLLEKGILPRWWDRENLFHNFSVI